MGEFKWLMRYFSLDPQQHDLKLRAVISRASQGYFGELVPIDAISTWRQYVDILCERGLPLILLAEAYQKDQTEINSAEAVMGPSEAVVDESDLVNIRARPDVGDISDIQLMGVADEGSTSLA